MKPSVSICVPLMISANAPMRARNWRVIANELSALADRRSDVEIVAAEWGGNYAEGYKHIKRVEGHGEFSRSKARNLAARIAASDLLCFLDTDMVMHPEGWDYAIEAAQRYDAFSPHRQYWRVGREAAEAMIDESERFRFSPHIRNFCPGIKPIRFAFAGGIVFIKRETLDRVGGWDEGFLGWGAEDTALYKLMRAARCTMGRGGVSRPLHLFHEVNHTANKQSAHHFRRYYGRRRLAATVRRKVTPIHANKSRSDKYATHTPILAALARCLNAGDVVVEFGAGQFSTPLLASMASEKAFEFHSYESSSNWMPEKSDQVVSHELTAESIKNDIEFVKQLRPSLVFVDTGFIHKRETFRAKIVSELLPFAKWIVAHDTEERHARIYKYDFSAAKHVKHFNQLGVRTTVASASEPIPEIATS